MGEDRKKEGLKGTMEGHLHWGVSVPCSMWTEPTFQPQCQEHAASRARLLDPLPTVAPSTLSFLSQHSNTVEGLLLRELLARVGSQALLSSSFSCSWKRWGLLPHAHRPGKRPAHTTQLLVETVKSFTCERCKRVKQANKQPN